MCDFFAVFLKKGNITVIRNFENAIVLKVKIVKRLKVEVVSYNQVFRPNFRFNNLKETSSKIQGASYNRENTVYLTIMEAHSKINPLQLLTVKHLHGSDI